MLNGTPIRNSSRDRWTLVHRLIWLKATVLAASGAAWQTDTGPIVSFIAPRAHQLKELVVNIEPVQSGSGDPSPDNVRPISGWTGCEVTRTGKNLFDVDAVHSGVNSAPNVTRNGVEFSKPATYTIKANTSTGSVADYIGAKIRHSDGTFDSVKYIVISGVPENAQTITITDGDTLCLYDINNVTLATSKITFETANIQVEIGSEATDYEQFVGETINVEFPDTVYAGNPDIVSGVTPITMGYVDLGDLTWTLAPSGRHSADNPTDIKAVQNNETMNAYCSQYAVTYGGGVSQRDMRIGMVNATQIQVNDSRYNGLPAEEFKAAMSGVQFVYELADPVEMAITPTPVNALNGNNVIWSDAGDVTVTFRGTPIVEPDAEPLQALNLLLGGSYRNNQTQDDVPDEEALDILLGGADR